MPVNDHSDNPNVNPSSHQPDEDQASDNLQDDRQSDSVQPFPPDAVMPPIPRFSIPALNEDEPPALSPIRPSPRHEYDSVPRSPLAPTPPERTPIERQLTPREQMQRAEEALINLRQKMARVAADFANGNLNQAQFDAIYARYSDQRAITERLLARNPESQAWQSVVQTGHTQFLKQHYAARPLSYAIYDRDTFHRIALTGQVQIKQAQIEAVLKRLNAVIAQRGNPGPAHKRLPDGKCVLFVPGSLTAAVVIYSLEPATAQINRARDMHNDFERANNRALTRQDYDTSRMVFPHRALFEIENQ